MTFYYDSDEALAAILPYLLDAYALNSGWRRARAISDIADLYVRAQQPDLLVPRDETVSDYPRVVAQLVDIFAAAQDKPRQEVIRDLQYADRDVIRLRAVMEADEEISATAGVDLLTGARDLLLAAASSLGKSQSIYRPGRNSRAVQYLDKLRMGHTEEGSFVLTFLGPRLSPLTEVKDSELLPSMAQFSLERRVTERLSEALNATQDATRMMRSGDSQAFWQATGAGASANLCDALALAMHPFEELHIKVSWALTRPKPSESVGFARVDVPLLREASVRYRATSDEKDTVLWGTVESLRRRADEPVGTIRLRATVAGDQRLVKMSLSDREYSAATAAHDERARIKIEGTLVQIGQRWQLLDPHGLEVVGRRLSLF